MGTYSVPAGSLALCRSNFSLLMVGCLSFGASCEALRQAPGGKTQTRLFFFFFLLRQKFAICKNKAKSETDVSWEAAVLLSQCIQLCLFLAMMGQGYLLMHPSSPFQCCRGSWQRGEWPLPRGVQHGGRAACLLKQTAVGENEVKIGVHDKKQFLHDCQCLAGLFHVVQV